jgi:hypothetical protein
LSAHCNSEPKIAEEAAVLQDFLARIAIVHEPIEGLDGLAP